MTKEVKAFWKAIFKRTLPYAYEVEKKHDDTFYSIIIRVRSANRFYIYLISNRA